MERIDKKRGRKLQRREWAAFALAALLVCVVFAAGILDRQKVWSDLAYYYMQFDDGQTTFDLENGDAYGVYGRGPWFDLSKGIYQMKIRTFADGNNEIHVVSGNNAAIEPSTIQLNADEMDCIVDLNILEDAQDVEFLVDFHSGTRMEFVDIRLYSPRYRDHAFTFAFAVAAICLLYTLWIKGYLPAERRGRLILMAAAVLVVSAPSLRDHLSILLDTNYHLARILNLADGLQSGQIPVRVGGYTYNGYGAVTSVFYPDFLLYPAALLILGGASLQYAVNTLYIALHMASAAAMYAAAKRIFEDKWIGTCAAILYTCSIYRITDIYVRGALGEALAMSVLPLFILGLWEVFFGDKSRWKILTLGAAGIYLSHMLSTLMCLCLAAGMFVVFLPRLIRERRLLPIVKAALCTMLLCLFQLVPFLDYCADGIGAQMLRVSMAASAISPAQLFLLGAGDMPVDPKDPTLSGMPLEIGLPLLLGVALALYCCQSVRDKKAERSKILLLTAAGALFAFMCTTAFPWEHVSRLTMEMADYIQFPWRFLMFVSVLFSMVGAYGYVRVAGQRSDLGVVLALMAALYAVIPTIGEQTRSNDYLEFGQSANPNLAYVEYTIPGTQTELTTDRNVLLEGDVTVTAYEKRGTCVTAQVNASGDAAITLPLFGYDGYKAEVNGEEMEISLGENNRLTVHLPAGTQGKLHVWFAGKAIWRAADAVSACTLLAFIAFSGKRRRRTDDDKNKKLVQSGS